MRISYWSSVVCSSDLPFGVDRGHLHHHDHPGDLGRVLLFLPAELRDLQRLQGFRRSRPAAGVRPRLAPADAVLLFRPRRRGARLSLRAVAVAFDLRHRAAGDPRQSRSDEHTSELQTLMRISYHVFCLKINTITLPSIKPR